MDLGAVGDEGHIASKRALNVHLHDAAARVLDLSFYLEAATFGTADLKEAVQAFHDKRPGIWQGR